MTAGMAQAPEAPLQAVADGCGAPAGGVPLPSTGNEGHAAGGAGNQAVVQGRVTRGGEPVAVGYARLLNPGGEFVAEVPLGADGGFRFFAAPGDWTLRILAPGGITAQRGVTAAIGEIRQLDVAV